MWVKIVLSNGIVVYLISAKVIVRHSVLLNTIFLCLLSFLRPTFLVVRELVVIVSSSVIDSGVEAHREVSNSHVLNLANVRRFVLIVLFSRVCMSRRCFLEEDWFRRCAETKVSIPWLFLELGDLPLCLSNILHANSSRSSSWHV